MGFFEEWIAMIMKCISSVGYTMVINGRHGKEFQPHRGLRQWDSLSQYLFLICAEGFSQLLALAKVERRISATRMDRGSVSVSHLFFANNNMLFGEAYMEGAFNMKNVIKEYEMMPSQLVNFDKSLIYFSENVDLNTQNQVSRILWVRISNNPKRYLGLPTMVGCRKKHAFLDIKEHFGKFLHNWSMRVLSVGGKEVFLKSFYRQFRYILCNASIYRFPFVKSLKAS